MRKDKKYLKKKGVTLISLVIIVVVLLVLSSIIIYVNTSGGTLAARVDKQSKTANEQYLVEESKVIISETYGQKKGTTKDEILNLEREKLDNLKKQYEKRNSSVWSICRNWRTMKSVEKFIRKIKYYSY